MSIEFNHMDLKDLCDNISICISKMQYANAEEERDHKDNLQILIQDLHQNIERFL
jgi:hypothetical protein